MNNATKVFLVLLRVAIGWHFLYEGIFKIDLDRAPENVLTSRYFLQASVARLQDSLRQQPGPAAVSARLDQWNDDVAGYFQAQGNALTEQQKDDLAALRDRLKLAAIDDAATLDWYFVHQDVLKLAATLEGKHFSSMEYLQAAAGPFRSVFRGMVPDLKGLERLTVASAQERIERRYRQIVSHYRSRGYALDVAQQAKLAAERDRLKQSMAEVIGSAGFQARLADYRAALDREARSADTPAYAAERLNNDRKRLDVIAAELTAFVEEPLAELAVQAQSVLTPGQWKAGPPPSPAAQTWLIDWMVKWGLTAIGLCLLLGLFTNYAAAAAAVQLAVFFLASPPLPGAPASTMGGHFLYVDRNLIEMLAALVLFTVPSGRWAGLDVWVEWALARRTKVNVATEVSA